jgi:predicted glycoside hydrolase/deacetylase ChbG (UPF0249 family)
MKARKLIVNADDFGQSEGVNKGIIKSFEEGILTSASLMVRYPKASVAADYANKNSLDIGLHVDLGEWVYVNGNWEQLYSVVNVDDVSAVKDEVENQLEKFQKITGVNPTHLDSHQHVHMNKHLQHIFMDVARRLNIPLRKCSNEVTYCGGFYGQNSDGTPFHNAISVEGLKETINTITNGITELACHPGINIEFATMYKKERDLEVKSLCDKKIREALDSFKIELRSFKGLSFE